MRARSAPQRPLVHARFRPSVLGWLLAGLAGLTAGVGHAAEVRISIRPAAEGWADAEAVTLEVRGGDEGGRLTPTPREVATQVPGRLAVQLAADRIWHFQISGKSLWGERQAVFVPPEGTDVTIRVWPTGSVTGSLHGPRHEPLPERIDLRFRPSPATIPSAASLSGEVSCPVEEGSFLCRVPIGAYDLRLAAQPFVSLYHFGVNVSPEGETRLGRNRLRRGASVVGWVTAEDAAPSRDARAHLEPELGTSPEGVDGERLAQLSLARDVSERGFFQFAGVAPGSYRIVVEDRSFAPARREGIVVRSDAQIEIYPPLVLEPPRQVRLQLEPPADPWGDPWQIEIDSLAGGPDHVEQVADLVTSAEGVTSVRLPRGRYLMLVRTGHGSGWHEELFDVGGEALDLLLDVPALNISGHVRLGDEPLAARMVFGGEFATRAVTLTSDDSGDYQGILPHAGTWKVELAASDPPVERTFDRIRVSPLPGTDRATVSFELPDTRLRGQVIDEQGQPVASAIVAVSVPEGDEVDVRRWVDDEEGRFEIFGLPPGEALLRAEAGERMSDRLPVLLIEELDGPEIQLVVRDLLKIGGRVVSEAGAGVPGAALTVRGISQLHFWVRSTFTQADGRFVAELPAGESEAFVTVAAPGFALRTFRTPLPSDPSGELVVPVRLGGGTLGVDLGDIPPGEAPHLDLFVLHAGSFLGYGRLASWAYQARGDLGPGQPIPNLEPGEYHLCRLDQAGLAAALFGSPPEDSCAWGFLTEGGRLDLVAPSPLAAPEVEPKAPPAR